MCTCGIKTELKLSIGTKQIDETGKGKKGEDSQSWKGQAQSILFMHIKLSLCNLALGTIKKIEQQKKVQMVQFIQFIFGKQLTSIK